MNGAVAATTEDFARHEIRVGQVVEVEVNADAVGMGELLLTRADREQDQTSVFSVNDFTRFTHVRRAIGAWAAGMVEVWNTPVEHGVDDMSPFTANLF